MKKVLIIGGNGFVGGQLAQYGHQLCYTCAVADTHDACNVQNVQYFCCDIQSIERLIEVFDDFSPSLAINVAAIADIDKAQSDKTLAYAINVAGAKNCAIAAKHAGCKYVWFSSDAVFSGEEEAGYCESSKLQPVNYYGESKMLGEEAVFCANADAIILRLSLILGFPLKDGNAYLAKLYSALKEKQVVQATTLEIRTPIDIITLCEAVYELFECDYKGVIHLGATGHTDRYTLAQMLAEELGEDVKLISPVNSVVAGKARRHRYGVLDVSLAQKTLLRTKMKSLQETIQNACLIKTFTIDNKET